MVWVSGPDIPGFEQRYRFVYPLIVPVLRAVWRNATPLVAKCADEIKMIQQVNRSILPIYVPNGVDLTHFQPGTPIPDDGPLHIICVARLIKRKGQHHLIQAVKQLVAQGIDIEVSLVGTGDALEEYQVLARTLGVADQVHFVGYVPREEIGTHFQAAHVFVLPSFAEGMAIAALEGMACGLPVVMTRTGGAEEIVEEGVNGFTFDWADVDSLVAHLRCLADNRMKARRMGEVSRIKAMNFSWDSIAERYLELFDDMMSHKHVHVSSLDSSLETTL
jgi:glycosyltransferase involved in cell wall biosynthesis